MLITITPAAVEPVSLSEAKAHLRVIHNADDVLIGSLITSAREVVELNTGRALEAASYLWTSDGGCWPVRIPLWPVAEITEVSYADNDGLRVPITDYVFDVDRSLLTFRNNASWTTLNVAFTTAPTHVPAALKAAILLLVGDLYEHAEANAAQALSENPTLDRLIFPHRINLGV